MLEQQEGPVDGDKVVEEVGWVGRAEQGGSELGYGWIRSTKGDSLVVVVDATFLDPFLWCESMLTSTRNFVSTGLSSHHLLHHSLTQTATTAPPASHFSATESVGDGEIGLGC